MLNGPAGVTIFLHIPKTGGTSFRDVVEQVYPHNRCISAYSLEPVALEGVKARIGEADAVYGHLFYGVHKILGVGPRYVTIVRNPIERVISFYRHQARDENSEHFEAIADGMTLRDLLASDDCPQVNNHMVRIVSGYEGSEPVHDGQVLRRAFANLEDFECVGVAERMNESVAVIAERLGWVRIPLVPRLNTSPSGEMFCLDEATRAAILSRNALDLLFYARVAARFDQQFRCVSNRQRRAWSRVIFPRASWKFSGLRSRR